MGRGAVAMPVMGGGRPTSTVLLPCPVPFLLAVISAVAVVAVAVPLVDVPATEQRPPEGLGGCVYGGSEYAEGEAVVTDEHCLNCTCSRGALICHLRACPPVPRTPGCKAVRKGSHACCPSIVCDYFDASERGPNEESTLSMNTTVSGCDEDGEHYEEGSYVSGKAGPCENCFCTQGTVKCKLTPCPPAPIGCTALFGHEAECCPSRYDCSTAPSLTLPDPQNGINFESDISSPTTEEISSTNELENEREHKKEISGSSYDQVTQIPASTVSANGDGRKNRLMDKSTTEESIEDATPTPSTEGTAGVEEAEGGEGSGATQEESTYASETSEEDSSATTTEQTTTETEEGALTSAATTELSIENTKTEVIDETTTEKITTLSGESGLPEEGEASTDGTTTEEATVTMTTVTFEEDTTTVTTEDMSYTQTTTTEVPEETTTDITTTELPTGKETTEETSDVAEEGTTTTVVPEDETEGDNVKVSSPSEGNTSVTVGMGEDLSQKSSHLVDIGAQGIDCEVQVNQSAGNEKEEVSATMSSEKAANQSASEGEAEVFKEGKMNSTEGAMVETTPSSVESSITTMLSIDRKKDVDYGDYDYNEPTLPPSLPNLRIIPFVAADAVVDKDNHKTTENSIFFDGAPPSLFSPPVETEGGFVPREPPLLHDVTYQAPVLGDVLPLHSDLGLAGIAAIDITTTSKPNLQGNFGLQDNDVNETLASGILDASLHIAEKPIYPYVTDKRPTALDTKLPSLLPIPLNFSLHSNSTLTTTVTSAPTGSVSSIQSTLSTSSGFSAQEIARPLYTSDRVSEIPYGPTPPRPSPSTSPSYSTGPHITPEKTPSPSALLMGPSKPQNSPVVGLLKLAGCNIYGRMYRVGRIISELSGPCLECRCTEVGVQCRPLPC